MGNSILFGAPVTLPDVFDSCMRQAKGEFVEYPSFLIPCMGKLWGMFWRVGLLEVTNKTGSRLPTVVSDLITCSLLTSFSCITSPLSYVFSGITFQINHLLSNPHLRASFWGTQIKAMISSFCCFRNIQGESSDGKTLPAHCDPKLSMQSLICPKRLLRMASTWTEDHRS